MQPRCIVVFVFCYFGYRLRIRVRRLLIRAESRQPRGASFFTLSFKVDLETQSLNPIEKAAKAGFPILNASTPKSTIVQHPPPPPKSYVPSPPTHPPYNFSGPFYPKSTDGIVEIEPTPSIILLLQPLRFLQSPRLISIKHLRPLIGRRVIDIRIKRPTRRIPRVKQSSSLVAIIIRHSARAGSLGGQRGV